MDRHVLERVREAKAAHEGALLQKANVVGVGIGMRRFEGELTDQPAIVVLVSRKIPSADLDPHDIIPRELEGIPVDVQEVGTLRVS